MSQQPREQPENKPYDWAQEAQKKIARKNWEDMAFVVMLGFGFWVGGGRHLRAIARNTSATRHGVDELRKLASQPIVVLPK